MKEVKQVEATGIYEFYCPYCDCHLLTQGIEDAAYTFERNIGCECPECKKEFSIKTLGTNEQKNA